jgi:hypothetical protein
VKRALPALALTLAAAGPALAQDADAARARLEMFIGRWTLLGDEERVLETCRWYADKRSFVVCESEAKTADGVLRAVSVLGYDDVAARYTYHHYNDRGRSRSQQGWWADDGTLRFAGERVLRGKPVREQVTIRRHERGFTLVEQRSVEGGDWQTTGEAEYRRLR